MTRKADERVKRLMFDAKTEADAIATWFGIWTGETVVAEMLAAGIALDDIPDWLEDYAAWLRANLWLFRDDPED
jgi:hypothetical protein